jgi:hypothetical protein
MSSFTLPAPLIKGGAIRKYVSNSNPSGITEIINYSPRKIEGRGTEKRYSSSRVR